MNTGGISNKSIINIIKKTFEDYRVIKKNNLMGFVTLIFLKILENSNNYSQSKFKKSLYLIILFYV